MTNPQVHPAFDWVQSSHVPSLNLELQSFRHRETGALHLHLSADDDQNTFLVGFRTVPQDSTGVAHILEHTSLCGSRHYPVRDPFFMMTRRSLNTFMNAFTSSDWTAYPFASRNRKDFDNLLKVYLDAVFYPTLDPLDFAQEGHRVEFAESENPESELLFKGVVFNEMKGAMSSPVSALWQSLSSALFPTITYHYNSGGEPANIPDLSYAELKAFHADHYHPSNALFMTYGDVAAHEHQTLFEEHALKAFSHKALDIHVADEQRFSAPQQLEDRYALDGEEETEDKSHIVIGWLLDRSTDMEAVMTAHLLSGVLLDNGASPLRYALETTELGSAPSPLCGLQDSTREMLFVCGVEGSNPEQAEAVEQLVLKVLEDVAENGVDQEMVEAILHQLEFSQREVSGDGYPYGLHLILQALGPTLHGADPVAALDIDPILNRLRESITDPDFIKGLTRKLHDNPHRVRLVMSPDLELSAQRAAAEAERLAEMKAAMDESARKAVIEQSIALAERQNRQDDPEVLPKVGLDDIPTDLPIPEGSEGQSGNTPTTWFSRATNGIVYHDLVIKLPQLDSEMSDLLPLLCDTLTEVGSGGRDYLTTQALQSAVTGGIGARTSVRSHVDDLEQNRGLFILSGKALSRNHDALGELLLESLETTRFDELPRLRELIAQERLHQEQGVTSHGHALAMTAASSGLSRTAALSHRWQGLAGLKSLKALDDSLDDNTQLEQLAEKLQQLRDRLLTAPRELLLIGEESQHDAIESAVDARWRELPFSSEASHFVLPDAKQKIAQAWTTSTQVNFCARAYPAVASDHPDAAPLMVLGAFLRNNFLHRTIREQGGAYGGGASYDSDAGALRFYSYRDPRLEETLTDFDASIDWLLSTDHEWRTIEEAILGIISSIDKPGSPAGEARVAYYAKRHGRTPEQRRDYRRRVLQVTEADLKRVAECYLKPEAAHTAIITSPATLDRHPNLGLQPIEL